MSSQVVTGNCLINGSLNDGHDGLSGVTATTTIIKGIVQLGDENNPNTVTRANGKVNLGWSQAVNIRGQVNINTNTENGITATTIGNGSNEINLNTTNIKVGNDLLGSVTQIKGKNIKIADSNTDGTVQLGKSGLTADLTSGQTNNLLSSQNRIFNPKLCDNTGTLLLQNFNLNNPSFFVFNENTTRVNNLYSAPNVGSVKNVVFYLNNPSLLETYTYTFSFEFYYYMMTGKLSITNLSPIAPSTSAKVINSSFSLILTKLGGDTAYTFTPYALHQNLSPFSSYSSTTGSAGVFPGMTGSCTPLGFAKGNTDGRIAITIQFPQMAQNGSS